MKSPPEASRRALHVAVVGSGEPDPVTDAAAERIGRDVARAGAVVVCGGLGGVMEAACRGAADAGGWTVGLLPGNDSGAANRWVHVAIATGLGELRNALVVRSSDVVIAVGGGHGTLSEIAFALKAGKPVVGVGTWALTRPGGAEDEAMVPASAEDAVEVAVALAGATS